MIILVALALVTGVALGWIGHAAYVRQMWRLERTFRRAAMGGRSRRKGDDAFMP